LAMHPIKVLFLVDGSFFIGISKMSSIPISVLDPRFKSSTYSIYACGSKRGSALILNLNPIFEIASSNSKKHLHLLWFDIETWKAGRNPILVWYTA